MAQSRISSWASAHMRLSAPACAQRAGAAQPGVASLSSPGSGFVSAQALCWQRQQHQQQHQQQCWQPSLRPAGRRAQLRVAAATAGSRPAPPFNVVVTGSTKGIGRALAEEFLRAGDNVVISSRDSARVDSTVEELNALVADRGWGSDIGGSSTSGSGSGSSRAVGLAANVARAADVAALADFAAEALGSVDLWINNAGSNAYTFSLLAEQSPEDLVSVVETNVLGVMLCCREAIRIMRDQPSGGHIFNMDGAGADGGPTPRFAAYGATKRSLDQLGKSLRAELRMAKLADKVGVHNLSPGMVTTDLLMAGADNRVSKFFINCLAESPETVARELVPRVRAVPAAPALLGAPSGQYIRFLTKPKAYGQILGRLATGARKNRWVAEDE